MPLISGPRSPPTIGCSPYLYLLGAPPRHWRGDGTGWGAFIRRTGSCWDGRSLGWSEVSAVASDPRPCASRLQGQGAAPRSIATMVPIVLVPTIRFERSSRVGVGRD